MPESCGRAQAPLVSSWLPRQLEATMEFLTFSQSWYSILRGRLVFNLSFLQGVALASRLLTLSRAVRGKGVQGVLFLTRRACGEVALEPSCETPKPLPV